MLEIVPRKAWGAMPNQWYISPVDHPAKSVWVFYTGNEKLCRSREECDPLVREVQRYHIEDKRDIPDFPFSFLVAANGLVYEGRGWHYSVPEPYDRKDLKNKRYLIAYIANDFEMDPNRPAYIAVNELIEYGIKQNYIMTNYEKYDWDSKVLPPPESVVNAQEAEARAEAEAEEAASKDL